MKIFGAYPPIGVRHLVAAAAADLDWQRAMSVFIWGHSGHFWSGRDLSCGGHRFPIEMRCPIRDSSRRPLDTQSTRLALRFFLLQHSKGHVLLEQVWIEVSEGNLLDIRQVVSWWQRDRVWSNRSNPLLHYTLDVHLLTSLVTSDVWRCQLSFIISLVGQHVKHFSLSKCAGRKFPLSTEFPLFFFSSGNQANKACYPTHRPRFPDTRTGCGNILRIWILLWASMVTIPVIPPKLPAVWKL